MRKLILLLCTLPAFAANYYVRDGASGSSCTDWSTNACDQLSTALGVVSRGDTIFVADGSYSSVTLSEANSGTSTVTIQKATVASHGTETGWDNTYGDGQADLNSVTIGTNYWIINGATRDEADWDDYAAYGFKADEIVASSSATSTCADNITISYVDVGGPEGSTYTGSEPDTAIYIACFLSEDNEDWYIGYSRLHNIAHFALVLMTSMDGAILEYNLFTNAWGKEAVRGQFVSKNIINRYNQYINACGTAPPDACTAEIAMWSGDEAGAHDGNEVYGNLFWRTRDGNTGGTVVIGGNGSTWVGVAANNTKVYNSTIVNDAGGVSCNILINGGTGNEVRNTLWYDCDGTPSAAPNTSSNSESSTDVFVNAAAGNFHLTEHVAGTTLSAPYDEDMDGVTRGYNGTFDSGAFQYVDGGDSVPTVTTTTASSITSSTASSGGNVTADGGQSVTSRGACYATTPTPTTPCTSDGTGTGSFTSSLTGLIASTTYYYRAFATNSVGTGYGSESTFETDAASMGIPVAIKGTVTVKGSGRTK